jgi:oxaloacetate decarboxylase gamma subunit
MSTSLVWQGLELMLVGMGTVFAFLILLVFATALMSRLVLRFEGSPDATIPVGAHGEAEEVAAIAAAIAEHRRRML